MNDRAQHDACRRLPRKAGVVNKDYTALVQLMQIAIQHNRRLRRQRIWHKGPTPLPSRRNRNEVTGEST